MITNTPQYSELTPIIANPARRSQLADQIARLVRERSYEGINLDIEGVMPGDRSHLTAFLAEVSRRLRPEGRFVTVAVPAKDRETHTEWAGAYDFGALAAYVDYAIIMAYAFQPPSGSPGPGAPLPWVRQSAVFAASSFGREKVILGIPLYGYDWSVTRAEATVSRKHSEVMDLYRQFAGRLGVDRTARSPFLRYVKAGQEHLVWFEDVDSFRAKVAVARELGLAGWGVWRLGQEDPLIWEEVDSG